MSSDSEREWIEDRFSHASDAYDRAVLWLSGGAAALSIAFVDDIASDTVEARGLTLTAWILLALAVMLITASHLVAVLATKVAADRLKARGVEDQARYDQLTAKINRRNRYAAGLSIAAGGSLGLGLIALGIFAYENLPTTT